MPPSRGLKAVLFDRDDTIAYTDPEVYREAATWAAQRYGLDARNVGLALHRQWQERAGDFWRLRTHDDEAAFWNAYGEELTTRLGLPGRAGAEWIRTFPYERYMKPVPNARDVITALRARGLKIGVLSNTLPSIDRTLDAVGLSDLIDVAIATCSIGVHKPDAGAFLHATDALGVQPHEVLFVDDKPENVQAARALGMHALQIDLSGRTPDAIHDLSDVLTWAAT